MAPKLVKAMQRQISTLVEKTTSRSDTEALIKRKLSRSVSHDRWFLVTRFDYNGA